jgi:hypothetical protein
MEERAEAKVIEAIRLEGNSFECVLHVERDFASDQTLVRAIFDVNGRRMVVDRSFSREKGPMVIMSDMADAIAAELAREVLRDAFAALLRQNPLDSIWFKGREPIAKSSAE